MPLDYLDDFLDDFDVDNEFSNFAAQQTKTQSAAKTLNVDTKLTNDWSIPIGEIEEDINSSVEDENDAEKSSNENEEQANSQAPVSQEDTEEVQPVIASLAAKSWSGVQIDKSKINSVIENIKTKDAPSSDSNAPNRYVPKVNKSLSQAPTSGNSFPALGEEKTVPVETTKPINENAAPRTHTIPAYGSAMSANLKAKKYEDILKGLEKKENKIIDNQVPRRSVETAKPETEQKQSSYQIKPKTNQTNFKKSENETLKPKSYAEMAYVPKTSRVSTAPK